MENQQLKLDLSNNSTLVLELTGNPWTDFGIVSFCADLRFAHFHIETNLTAHEANITLDTSNLKEVETWLNQKLKEKWNQLYLMSRGAKILGHSRESLSYDNQKFIDRDTSKRETTQDDRAQIREKWKNSTIGDMMPLTQLRSNFIGINGNADKFRKEQQTNISEFIENWQNPTGKKVCEISGRTANKPKKLLQVVNPFANKHLSTKVRGTHGSNTNPTIGEIYYLISLWATLDKCIPFSVNTAKQTTHLILPDVPDLDLLTKVYDRLQRNLKDLDRPEELWTFTNLRTTFGTSNQYSLAISLFHNIFYEFSPKDEQEESEGDWHFSPLENVTQLTRWIVIPFSKGQNVIFRNFHAVQVDARLYDFIKPIDFKPIQIQLVPDILVRMSSQTPDAENTLGQLSQAIATSNPLLMKIALFNLWKHQETIRISLQRGAPHPVRLLSTFINHFLEVNQVLNEELRDDLRALGTTIGKTFYKDVTLISKLFNVSSLSAFREALSVVTFRFYKFSTGDAAKEAVPIKPERVNRILDELNEDNYKEIAETLSTYVSLNAYNAKIFEAKSNNEGD